MTRECDVCLNFAAVAYSNGNSSQVSLIEGSAVTQTDKKLISNLFSFTHFLQARTNFSKLKASVCEVLKASCEIRVVADLPSEMNRPNECVEELLDMMRAVRWASAQNKKRADIPEGADEQISSGKYLEKESFFRRMWNGVFTTTPTHICCRDGPNPCCSNNDESQTRMAESMIGLAFSAIPSTPAPGKWTKLWEPLMFLVFTTWSHLLQPCFEKVVTGFAKEPGEIDPELDPALQAVLQWSKITGIFVSHV